MRNWIYAEAALLAVSGPPVLAQGADSFPARPVTIILAVAAGGPTDVEARLYAQKRLC